MRNVSIRVFAVLAIGLLAFSAGEAQQVAPTPAPAAPTAAPAPTASNVLLGGLIDTSILPANFAATGVGIAAGQTLHGGSALCHSVSSVNYLCAQSLYSGSTTANTVVLKQVLVAKQGFVFAIDGNAGVATGADGGTGAALSAGGSALYNVSRLPILRKHPGLWLGFSAAWDKRDVSEFAGSVTTVSGLRAALKPFASKGDYTFFLGKSW